MTKLHLLALGAAALALTGCNKGAESGNTTGTAAASAAAPAQGGDWTQTVSPTPEGGFVMGNPNAPVKLVEYLSLTCNHCAEFAKSGYPQIRDQYVKKGTVSLEIRNYVRDPIDVTASIVTRCGGAQPYFAMTEQVLAQQADLFTKMQAVPPAQMEQLQAAAPAQQFKTLAGLLGIDQFARQRGVTQDKLDACFADEKSVNALIEMQKAANAIPGFVGTPTFLLNGNKVEAGTWEQLEPQLKQAGA